MGGTKCKQEKNMASNLCLSHEEEAQTIRWDMLLRSNLLDLFNSSFCLPTETSLNKLAEIMSLATLRSHS